MNAGWPWEGMEPADAQVIVLAVLIMLAVFLHRFRAELRAGVQDHYERPIPPAGSNVRRIPPARTPYNWRTEGD